MLSNQLEQQVIQMNVKIKHILDRIENPQNQLYIGFMFILSDKAKEIFEFKFLNEKSEVMQGLPVPFKNDLLKLCDGQQPKWPIIIDGQQVCRLLRDFQDYIYKQVKSGKMVSQENSKQLDNQAGGEIGGSQGSGTIDFPFESPNDADEAFTTLLRFLKYNNTMSAALNEFHDYIKDNDDDGYKEACDALGALDGEPSDASLEDDISELKQWICLPSFDSLETALDGNLDQDEVSKFISIETVEVFGVKKMGPLPLLPRLMDLDVFEELDLDVVGKKTKEIVENANTYFSEDNGHHLNAIDVLHQYACDFLCRLSKGYAGVGGPRDRSDKGCIQALEKAVSSLCTLYNKHQKGLNQGGSDQNSSNGQYSQINPNSLTTNEIDVLQHHFMTSTQNLKTKEQKRIAEARKAEADHERTHTNLIDQLTKSAVAFVTYANAWIDSKSSKK